MPLYLGPVTVVGQRLGDRFEVKLTSFEFRCFGADLRPKTKPKMLKHFRPKNENDRNNQKLSFSVPTTKTKFGRTLLSTTPEKCHYTRNTDDIFRLIKVT